MVEKNGKKELYQNNIHLRAMETKVRDLASSRDKWKEKALELEASLKQKEKEIEELKKKINKPETNQK